MSSPILRLAGLHKSFGALVATDNITLDLSPGECHALIGPNGAGKTTLIHQISGVLKPDAGRIFFAEQDVTDAAPYERAQLGMARSFQITSIIPGFTVLENVALAAQARSGSSFRFFGRAKAETALNDAAIQALTIVGLEARRDTVAGSLSHGEKRSLELAIALAMAPKALILDEPMAGMGREESARLITTLRELKSRVPILLVEHDMEAVFALADRVSVLVYGRIIASGAPEEIRADPEVRSAYLGEDAA
ncbi:MAG: ABC transporter ATP-binding protein [Pseudomonadota bacterium]